MNKKTQRIIAILMLVQMFLSNGIAAEQINQQVLQEVYVYAGHNEYGWPYHYHYYITEDVLIEVDEPCDDAEICSKCLVENDCYNPNSGVIYYSYYEPCYNETYDNIDYDYLFGE